jgi:hypothetical protein
MATLYRLETYRPPQPLVYFSRRELQKLLSLYSRQVAAGQWRDYAIDHSSGGAIFSIFKRSMDRPAYRVIKRIAFDRSAEYLVAAGGHTLARGRDLAGALSVLDRSLRVVS